MRNGTPPNENTLNVFSGARNCLTPGILESEKTYGEKLVDRRSNTTAIDTKQRHLYVALLINELSFRSPN